VPGHDPARTDPLFDGPPLAFTQVVTVSAVPAVPVIATVPAAVTTLGRGRGRGVATVTVIATATPGKGNGQGRSTCSKEAPTAQVCQIANVRDVNVDAVIYVGIATAITRHTTTGND